MIGFSSGPKNGDTTRKSSQLERVARALAWEDSDSDRSRVTNEPIGTETPLISVQETTIWESPAPNPKDEGSFGGSLQEPRTWEPPAPGLEDHGVIGPSDSPVDTDQGKQDRFPNPTGMNFQHVCKSFVEALLETAAGAADGLRRQTANDHANVEAIADRTLRMLEEIDQIRSTLTLLSARAESFGQREAELRSKLAVQDERLCSGEQSSQRLNERMDGFLAAQEESIEQVRACVGATSDLEARALASGEKLDALSKAIQAQTDTDLRLNALYTKLQERLTAQEKSIQAIETELRQRGGLLARVLGTLRNLDLRAERRFPADRTVKVVFCGDQEAVVDGRVVDASESGLGLMLRTPATVGGQVRIHVDDTCLSGEVTYCGLQGADGYRVGVKLAANP